jgi:hypothetical protein
LEQLETRAVPAAITVSTTADDPNVPIQGQVTLRDAINQMNKSDDPTNTISFAANVVGNLQLQAALPALSKNITIDGPGMAALDVLGSGPDAPTLYNVFTVMPNTTCKIDNISIAEGDGDFGGGIYNMGDLTLLDVSISDCSVTSGGGGIFNFRSGQLTMTSTFVQSNFAVHTGGGIENEGQLQVFAGSRIEGNSAGQGGGLFNAGATTIKGNSLINTNYASSGGGVYMSTGTVAMTGGSISNNSAVGGNGGGLYVNAGKLTLT